MSRIFKILCHATLDLVEILCRMLFLFKQATDLVGFKPKILTSLVVSMSVLFHCPSVLFRLVPGTQEAVYPIVQFSEFMVFYLGSDSSICSLGMSLGVCKQLYGFAFLSSSLSALCTVLSGSIGLLSSSL